MRFAVTLLSVAILSGCDAPVIEWTDPSVIEQAPGATELQLDGNGKVHFLAAGPAARGKPPVSGLCDSSLVFAAGPTRLHAAWWRVRPDSSAVLTIAASPALRAASCAA